MRFWSAVIAPPWGEAFGASAGLSLRRAELPVYEILDTFGVHFAAPMLFAIQLVRNTVAESVVELSPQFERSALHIYDSENLGGNRYGLLMGSRGLVALARRLGKPYNQVFVDSYLIR